MKDELPAVAKLAARVVAAIEEAVSRFPRRHRYSVGSDLRNASRLVIRLAHATWHERQRKMARAIELSKAVDDLKIEISIADLVKAWGSLGEMEAVARLVNDLGKQVGGWLKALQTASQNAAAERRPQRAPILSSRATPQGVAP